KHPILWKELRGIAQFNATRHVEMLIAIQDEFMTVVDERFEAQLLIRRQRLAVPKRSKQGHGVRCSILPVRAGTASGYRSAFTRRTAKKQNMNGRRRRPSSRIAAKSTIPSPLNAFPSARVRGAYVISMTWLPAGNGTPRKASLTRPISAG